MSPFPRTKNRFRLILFFERYTIKCSRMDFSSIAAAVMTRSFSPARCIWRRILDGKDYSLIPGNNRRGSFRSAIKIFPHSQFVSVLKFSQLRYTGLVIDKIFNLKENQIKNFNFALPISTDGFKRQE